MKKLFVLILIYKYIVDVDMNIQINMFIKDAEYITESSCYYMWSNNNRLKSESIYFFLKYIYSLLIMYKVILKLWFKLKKLDKH